MLDDMIRDDEAPTGSWHRQTRRDWVHHFNSPGPDSLLEAWTSGRTARLSLKQKSELAALVDAGPSRRADGVMRWRMIAPRRWHAAFSRSCRFPAKPARPATTW